MPGNGEAAAPEGEKKMRTKLVRVKQGYIDCLLREPTPKVPEEVIDNMSGDLREQLRTAQDEARAYMQRLVDKDLDVLEQYRTKGYAMEEVEVYDDEEDVEVYDDDEEEVEVDDDEEEEVDDDEEEVEVYVYGEQKEGGCVDGEAAEGGAKAAGGVAAARVGACRLWRPA
ncbi:unnamed protein product [Urochloa humidicola]